MSYLYLRKLTVEDTEQIVEWRNKVEVRSNFIYQNLFTREGHLTWFHEMLETKKAYQFMVCEKESNRAIGSVYLRDVDLQHQKAEYGIFIGETFARGKGYGTEAAKLILEYGFEELKLHRIYLRVFADNVAARRSYEKAGFVQEGYLKDDVCIQGEYRDIVWMAAVK